MPDLMPSDEVLKALEGTIQKPDSVYLLREVWMDNLENQVILAIGYNTVGAVFSREQAQNWVDKREGIVKPEEHWAAKLMEPAFYPYRKYERVRIIY